MSWKSIVHQMQTCYKCAPVESIYVSAEPRGQEKWMYCIDWLTESILLDCACVRRAVQQNDSNIFRVFGFLWWVECFLRYPPVSVYHFLSYCPRVSGTDSTWESAAEQSLWLTGGCSVCLNTRWRKLLLTFQSCSLCSTEQQVVVKGTKTKRRRRGRSKV